MASRAIWSPMADDKAAGAPVGVHGRRQAPPPSHEPAQAASTPAEPDSGPVRIDRGEPLPLGLHDCRDGLNIAVFSRHATAMTLLLYETAAGTQPSVHPCFGPHSPPVIGLPVAHALTSACHDVHVPSSLPKSNILLPACSMLPIVSISGSQ